MSRVVHRLDKDVISLRLSDAQGQAVHQAAPTVEQEDWVVATTRSAAVDRPGVLKAAEIIPTAHGAGETQTSNSSSRVPQVACRTHQQVECGITRTQKARLVDRSRKKV